MSLQERVGKRLDEEARKMLRALIEREEVISLQNTAITKAYQTLAQCIRSDQLSPAQVEAEMMADPAFAAWYKATYQEKAP